MRSAINLYSLARKFPTESSALGELSGTFGVHVARIDPDSMSINAGIAEYDPASCTPNPLNVRDAIVEL